MDTIKVVGTEASCNTTKSTFANAYVVRVFNSTAASTLITRRDAANTILGTFTLAANTTVAVAKYKTDTLESNNATTGVLTVPIAFTN